MTFEELLCTQMWTVPENRNQKSGGCPVSRPSHTTREHPPRHMVPKGHLHLPGEAAGVQDAEDYKEPIRDTSQHFSVQKLTFFLYKTKIARLSNFRVSFFIQSRKKVPDSTFYISQSLLSIFWILYILVTTQNLISKQTNNLVKKWAGT